MESSGTPGRIQVTKAIAETVPKGIFTFEPRGEIQVKGKGLMETLFLTNRLTQDYRVLNVSFNREKVHFI